MITDAIHELQSHLEGLVTVHVTSNQAEAENHLRQGRTVVLINPPRISTPTTATTVYQWRVYVAAGPFSDTLRATERIEPVLETIMNDPVLGIQEAEPQAFQTINNELYSCYVLTIDTDHT